MELSLPFRAKFFIVRFLAWCICFGPVCGSTVVVVVSRNANPSDSFRVFTNCSSNTCLSKEAVLQPGGLLHCRCRCLTSSSTFVELDDYAGSKCVDNVALRSQYAKCNYQLSPNTPNSPLSALDLSQQQPLNVTWTPSAPIPVCPVMEGHGQYLVKGKWYSGSNTTTFTLDNNVFKWSAVDPSHYQGRVVRVQFSCQSQTHCVVFKVKGTVTYIVDNSPTTTISPSPSLRPTSPYASTQTLVTLPTSKGIIIPVTSTKLLPTQATTTVTTSSTSVVPIGGTSSNQVHSCKRGTGVFCQWLYVGLSVAGCVVLLLVVIAVVSFACKRRRRKVPSSNKKNEGLFDSDLPSKKCSCNTELMTLVVRDSNSISKTLACPEHSSEEELHHNQNEKRSSHYRPLKFVESEVRQIIPTSVQRLSSISDDEFTNNDKRRLLRQDSSQSNVQTPERIKRTLAPKDAILHLENEEDEDTYEVMDTKMVPREIQKPRTNKGKGSSKVTGCINQSFQDDKRLSIYETVEDCKNSHQDVSAKQPNYETMETGFSDEQPNYETMETGYSDEQPNYETMEMGFSDEQPNYEAMEREFSDEQPNYEAMEREFSDEQPNYEAMEREFYDEQPNYEAMEREFYDEQKYEVMDTAHVQNNQIHKEPSSFSREAQREDDHDEVYEIPLIFDNEEDTEYEIPPIPSEFRTQCENSNTLTVPCYHGEQDDDVVYTYANTSEFQAREVREKLKGRKSWHSGEQPPKTRNANLSGTKTIDPGITRRKLSQGVKSNEVRAEDDGLYSVANHPKPPPDILRLGQRQHGCVNRDKDVPWKSTEPLGTNSAQTSHSAFLCGTTPGTSASHKTRKSSSQNLRSVDANQPSLVSQDQAPRRPNSSTKAKMIGGPQQTTGNQPNPGHIENSTSNNGMSREQPLYTNLVEMSNDIIESDPVHDSENSLQDDGGRGEVYYDNFVDENAYDNEQPLYENFEAMGGR